MTMTSDSCSIYFAHFAVLILYGCAQEFVADQFPRVIIIGLFTNGSTTVQTYSGVRTDPMDPLFEVEYLDTVPVLILQCQASFPVEWAYIDRFPATTDNLRGWHMNSSRSIPTGPASNLWDKSRFQFEANLTFIYRAPAEPRQQICRHALAADQFPATRVNAAIHGRFLRLNVTSAWNSSAGDEVIPTRYGNDLNCTYALELYTSGKICCERESDNFKFFSRGCSTHSNCRGLFNPASTKCLRNASEPALPPHSSRECISTSDVAGYGNAGFIVCGDTNNDSNSVAVHYYTSVIDLCSSSSSGGDSGSGAATRRQPELYLDRNERPPHLVEDTLLAICPLALPSSRLYVGETVEFTCFGTYYYFSSGFHFVLRSKKAADVIEHMIDGYEKVFYTKYVPEQDIIMSTRQLTSIPTRINGTSVFEVICVAPVWNSYEWVNKTLRLNVTEPTRVAFSPPGPVEEIILNEDMNITCLAGGDPLPRLTWVNNNDGVFLRQISNNRQDNITLEVNFDAWPSSQDTSGVTIVCQADQDRIGRTDLKTYILRRKPTSEFPTMYALAAAAVLLTLGFAVTFVIVWRIVVRTRDRWRSLNQDEIDEFLNGRANAKFETDAAAEIEANAWNCPYDPRFELSLKEDLSIGSEIATGEFGKVYVGNLHKRSSKSATVAVKKNLPFSSMIDFKASMYELKLLISLGEHENIVKLVGAVTTKIRKRQIFVVFEYCEHGSLKAYMEMNRSQIIDKCGPKPNPAVVLGANAGRNREDRDYYSTEELKLAEVIEMGLLAWVVQILNGMLFIRRKKVVHGDLAARNIVLDSDLNSRICDFGMSHQVTRSYYAYQASPQARKPCKWSAPESLAESCEYSFQSDVYSFGVLLWEIFSLGKEPWSRVRPENMLDVLASGEVLPMPVVEHGNADGGTGVSHESSLVPPCVYEKMKECWRLDPNLRPTVQELHEYFSNCLEQKGETSNQSQHKVCSIAQAQHCDLRRISAK